MSIRDDFFDLEDIYSKEGYDWDEAYHMVCKQWIKEGKYKKLYDFFVAEIEGNYVESINPYIDTFLEHGYKKLYVKYWNFLLNTQLKKFWYAFDYYKKTRNRTPTTEEFLSHDMKTLEENADKYPAYQDFYLNIVYDWHKVQKFINRYIQAMQKIDATEEIEKAKLLKESVYNLKKPKAKKMTDKRKIDENTFWELIKETREEIEDTSEFTDRLRDKLESMSAVEIKKFQKLLLQKMEELNHWDIWALAYIVRGGCGDDEFDYFKAWVVSKGKEVFESIKNMQMDHLKKLFENEEPQLEAFMYVAQEAYERKKYDVMPTPRVKSIPIQGKEWSEENICKSYPELCQMFNYGI